MAEQIISTSLANLLRPIREGLEEVGCCPSLINKTFLVRDKMTTFCFESTHIPYPIYNGMCDTVDTGEQYTKEMRLTQNSLMVRTLLGVEPLEHNQQSYVSSRDAVE